MEGAMLNDYMCDALHNQICFWLTKQTLYVTSNILGRELVDEFAKNLLL